MTPQRQTKFVAEHGAGNCQQAAMASILDLSMEDTIDTADPEMRKRGFWKSIHEWLENRGLKLKHAELDDPALTGSYSIGVGPSPRGNFLHAVVCKNGRMVWDPHPSDDGVERFEFHDIIVPMTEVEILSRDLRRENEARAA